MKEDVFEAPTSSVKLKGERTKVSSVQTGSWTWSWQLPVGSCMLQQDGWCRTALGGFRGLLVGCSRV
eukprot:2523964-Prymnesium_polylepis.1